MSCLYSIPSFLGFGSFYVTPQMAADISSAEMFLLKCKE